MGTDLNLLLNKSGHDLYNGVAWYIYLQHRIVRSRSSVHSHLSAPRLPNEQPRIIEVVNLMDWSNESTGDACRILYFPKKFQPYLSISNGMLELRDGYWLKKSDTIRKKKGRIKEKWWLTGLPSTATMMSPRIILPAKPRVVGSSPALAPRLFAGTCKMV